MRRRIVTTLAATLLTAGVALSTPAVAEAAPAQAATANACSYNSTIGWHCGYYNGTAETDEWSTNTAAVKEIQDLINQETLYWENGHAQLAVDGSFGPATKAAVEWLQENYGICGGVNGNVGPCTWSFLRWNP
ncbi:peptidoglycan-binding protein [Streptomyces sp. RB6PN25]|uniref:Peptidoglycan-binding protein n=1 Tax=Streptomyces humicola TaxID=2953240 RepID=A0ABT1Q452_9ACTN|nr:peptidoglycan-binding domain-containing protein [Streptomyces humicola]MCQ4083527.1 peptidoglycan-binding protein [Streptomyces humicola]